MYVCVCACQRLSPSEHAPHTLSSQSAGSAGWSDGPQESEVYMDVFDGCMRACMRACVDVYMYVCMRVCMYWYVCVYVCMVANAGVIT